MEEMPPHKHTSTLVFKNGDGGKDEENTTETLKKENELVEVERKSPWTNQVPICPYILSQKKKGTF